MYAGNTCIEVEFDVWYFEWYVSMIKLFTDAMSPELLELGVKNALEWLQSTA